MMRGTIVAAWRDMSTLERLAFRSPLALYFLLTFGISWGGAIVAMGGVESMAAPTLMNEPRFAGAAIAMLSNASTSPAWCARRRQS
jgi:hypothetical protein